MNLHQDFQPIVNRILLGCKWQLHFILLLVWKSIHINIIIVGLMNIFKLFFLFGAESPHSSWEIFSKHIVNKTFCKIISVAHTNFPWERFHRWFQATAAGLMIGIWKLKTTDFSEVGEVLYHKRTSSYSYEIYTHFLALSWMFWITWVKSLSAKTIWGTETDHPAELLETSICTVKE